MLCLTMSYQALGTTPLERLQDRLNREARVCPACRYEDTESGWQAVTSGSRVQYRHICPSCGEISKRELRLGSRS